MSLPETYDAKTNPSKPRVTSGAWHRVRAEVRADILNLQMNSAVLDDNDKLELMELSGLGELHSELTASEINKQFSLVQSIRDQVLEPTGIVRLGSTVRDISGLVSAINSLIGLFLKNQATIDAIDERNKMKEAVLEAVQTLDVEAQDRFFAKLAEYE